MKQIPVKATKESIRAQSKLTSYFLVCALSIALPTLALAAELFSSGTEAELKKPIPVPKLVLEAVLSANASSKKQMDECLKDLKYKKGDYSKLFQAQAIQLNNDRVTDYFVRPVFEPYCSAFYGAHTFKSWFVTIDRNYNSNDLSAEIIFSESADGVTALKNVTNGYHDIEVFGHSAIDRTFEVYKFNGNKYVLSECYKQNFEDENKYQSACRIPY